MVENRNLFTHVVWIRKFSATFTLARKLNISPKGVFRKYGNNLTVTIPTESDNKRKPVSFAAPDTLKRDRTMRKDGLKNFDPFTVKYYIVALILHGTNRAEYVEAPRRFKSTMSSM
jgi:hypothetical protein